MPKDPKSMYAPFVGRMLASIIDTILSAIVLVPLFQLFEKMIGIKRYNPTINPNFDPAQVTYNDLLVVIIDNLPAFLLETAFMMLAVMLCWFYRSTTPGKAFLKMKIVDEKTLGKPTAKQFWIRNFSYIISTIVFGLGFIWIYVDKKKHQGWHDKLAGTVVIYKDRMPIKAAD